MRTILEEFLSALDISHTRRFASALYQEHPHRDNMYGLKRMLDVYGVRTAGVYVSQKDPARLNYPCILHTHGDFVIGLDCDSNAVRFLQHGKETVLAHDVFRQTWTGNALVVLETTDAVEPDYKSHLRDELVAKAKACGIPVILAFAAAAGLAENAGSIGVPGAVSLLLCCAGLLVCCLLMEKQLYGESRYGDRVCSLFHHADCSSVLDGPRAKVLGISWSEVGLGYFTASILLLSLLPSCSDAVAVINWAAMLYGVWSIHYQWRVARSWCVLCTMVQGIIWTTGIIAIAAHVKAPLAPSITGCLQSCMVFAVCIMAAHLYASARSTEAKYERTVQRYRALKANGDVASALIGKGEYYEATPTDSSIIFGNPDARMRVTILSNPHCNPCARMHKRVERLLEMEDKEICVQYVFSSFNEELEDSSRYLIYCYQSNSRKEALRKLALWYAKDKFDYKRIIAENESHLHTDMVEAELQRHRQWRKKTSLTATPTILVNGFMLPREYELEDLAMIANLSINEKNIMQDINGRSTTPLGAESQSAEEAVTNVLPLKTTGYEETEEIRFE